MTVDINRSLVTIGCIVSSILYIAAVSGDVWVKSTLEQPQSTQTTTTNSSTITTSQIHYYGIWKYCFFNGQCHRIGDAYNAVWRVTPTWLQAVRILACLATLLEGFGAANGIAGLLRQTYSSKESKICLFLGPLFMMLALSIYTAHEGPSPAENFRWGWCFIIGWLTTTVTPVYAIFAVS